MMNKDKVKGIIQNPNNLDILFTHPDLSGFSGKKIIALLQNLACCLDQNNEVYLEVGVFQGMSLISVSKVFGGATFGIDNFSQFDPDKKNYDLIRKHCEKSGLNNLNLLNFDFEVALKNLESHLNGKKIGLYFVDGPHDYRSQLMCLLLARPFLSEDAVIVVDDSNYRDVRQANDDFLSINTSFKLVNERYTTSHPSNMSAEEKATAINGWWDGINIMVNDNNYNLPTRKINTYIDKKLFYNDQYVHSSRYADCAPEAIKVANALKPFNPLKVVLRLIDLFKAVKKSDPEFNGKFRYLNTYTDDLI